MIVIGIVSVGRLKRLSVDDGTAACTTALLPSPRTFVVSFDSREIDEFNDECYISHLAVQQQHLRTCSQAA